MSLSDLPMPHPTNPCRPFKSYPVLSFDVYGTLIDYKPAIYEALRQVLDRLPAESEWRRADSEDMESDVGTRLLTMFKRFEDELTVGQKEMRPFATVLTDIYLMIAREIGVPADAAGLREEAERFGAAIETLPPYPDSVESCRRLQGLGFRLVFLSNIEKEASRLTAQTGPLAQVDWWKTYSASDFPQDDPDRRKLEFLIDSLAQREGVQRDQILHVANSLGHDHVPAKKLGLNSVWIVRDAVRWGKAKEMRDSLDKVGYGWRFGTLKEFADAVEEELKSA